MKTAIEMILLCLVGAEGRGRTRGRLTLRLLRSHHTTATADYLMVFTATICHISEKRRVSRVETSDGRELERRLVAYRSDPRNADAFWISRHVSQSPCFEVIFHFAQDSVEFASGDVALHLLVPVIVFPTVQPLRELGPLFERKVLDCSLYLGQAHVAKFIAQR